jgi:hypothetical protein
MKMNGFHDFDNFRVGAWMSDGVMIRLADAEKVIKRVVKKVAAAAVGAVIAASTVSIPATAATFMTLPVNEHVASSIVTSTPKAEAMLQAELDVLSSKMTKALADLDNEVYVPDPELLAMAQTAIDTSEQRQKESPLAIAEAFFRNGY